MLQIFKDHSPRTMLLDDFEFYEQREKSLQAIRRRQSARMNSDREFYDNDNHVVVPFASFALLTEFFHQCS